MQKSQGVRDKTQIERILTAPTERVWELMPHHNGFRAGTLDLWDQLAPHWQFMERGLAEMDPSFKQLIPYIILRGNGQVFRYRRTKRGGESRLHHLYSIGVGGHIDEADFNLFTSESEMLEEAAAREVREEMHYSGPLQLDYLGTLNDDSNDVGKVHLGLVFSADVGKDRPEIRESALSRGEWLDTERLNDGANYETWSQWLIEAIFPDNPGD